MIRALGKLSDMVKTLKIVTIRSKVLNIIRE